MLLKPVPRVILQRISVFPRLRSGPPTSTVPTLRQSTDIPAGDRVATPCDGARPWCRRDLIAAAGCLLVALLTRWHAADHGLSYDEIWILAGAAGHGSDCVEWTPDELRMASPSPTALEHATSPLPVWTRGVAFHPPLHMVTLWLWRAVFGGGDWIAAMYSAVWSVAGISFIFAAIRLQAGLAPATFVALTMALSPVQTQFGTEIRGYGMMIGLASCAAWQMVRMDCLGATTLRVWLLGLTQCPLQLTHYFAAGACIAVCMWAMVRLSGSLRLHFMAAVGCAAAVSIISWLPFALEHVERARSQTPLFLQTTTPFWSGAGRAGLGLPMKLLFIVPPHARGAFMLLLATTIATVAGAMRRHRDVTVWALLLWTPITMLMLIDLARGTHHTVFTRYAAVASVGAAAAPLLSGFLLHRAFGWTLGTVFIALTAIGFGGHRSVGSPSFRHMRQSLAPIIASEGHGLPIVSLRPTAAADSFFARAVLLEWSHAPGFFPRPAMMMDRAPPGALRALADSNPERRFWLVTLDRDGAGADRPDWLRDLIPSATLVRPPLLVPAGRSGVQPEPAVMLWLLELTAPQPVGSGGPT
jgi:hypothetical protein